MQRMRKANALMPESTLRTRGKRMMLTRQDKPSPTARMNELPEKAYALMRKAGMAFAAFADLRPWGEISLGAAVVSSGSRSSGRRSRA